MKFDELFKMNEPEFFKKAELNETFIRQIEEIGEDYYDYVIESIISVNTNNAINQSGHIQGAGEPFKHEPLLGLYKTHSIGTSIESVTMNMLGAFEHELKLTKDQQNEFDIDFTEEGKTKSLEYLGEKLREGKDISSAINEYSKDKGKKLLSIYQQKREHRKLTGHWLIFGKSDNKNIFLYLSVGYDHSKENDKKIYRALVDMYSESFIQELKSKGVSS